MGSVIDKTVSTFTGGLVNPDLSGAKSADRAYDAQERAAHQANVTALQTKEEQKKYLEPYYNAGNDSIKSLSSGDVFGEGGFQADPGYQFRMAEGMKAINASAAARGGANSGATLKALTKYGQDYASNEYNNAYNRNYNRLSQLAGYGSNAAANFSGVAGVAGQQIGNNQIGLGNADANRQVTASNNDRALLNSMMQAGGQAAGAAIASDERLKENIESVSKSELSEMKKHLKAYKFNYKSDKWGSGDYVGVMAQDLEKSKLGKTLVIEDAEGNKLLDINRILMLFLATMAEA